MYKYLTLQVTVQVNQNEIAGHVRKLIEDAILELPFVEDIDGVQITHNEIK